MPRSKYRATLAVVSLLAMAACSSSTTTQDPVLTGVESIGATALPDDVVGTPTVEAVGDREVIITFDTGTCGAASDAPDLPRSLDVTYGADEISMVADTSIDCEGPMDDIAIFRAAEVILTEAIDGRTLSFVTNPR